MYQQTDYSAQLFEIGEIFAAGLCLSGTDPHCIPDRLRSGIEDLRKATPAYLSLDGVEMIVVAVLLHETCTGLSPGGRGTKVLDLLNHIFTQQIPLSGGLSIVKLLCDNDIMYARKYLGRPVATAFTKFGKGVITDLFYDTVSLSERTSATTLKP